MVREYSKNGWLQALSENLTYVRTLSPEQLGFGVRCKVRFFYMMLNWYCQSRFAITTHFWTIEIWSSFFGDNGFSSRHPQRRKWRQLKFAYEKCNTIIHRWRNWKIYCEWYFWQLVGNSLAIIRVEIWKIMIRLVSKATRLKLYLLLMVSIKKSCICRLAFSFSYDYSSKYAVMDKCAASYYKSLPTFIDMDT